MAKINEIDITSLTFQEGSAPTTPASTKWKLYAKTDGLYFIDDAGTETGPFGSGSVGTQTSITFSESAAPGTPSAGEAVIYVKTDGKLYLKDDTGTETDLTATGGGGTVSPTPDASDEFDDASWGGTTVDPASPTTSVVERYGVLSVNHPGGDAAEEIHGYMIPFSPAGDFCVLIRCRATIEGTGTSFPASLMVGVMAADGTTHGAGNQIAYVLDHQAKRHDLRRFTNYSTQAASDTSGDTMTNVGSQFSDIYLALQYTSSSNLWKGYYGPDGVTWWEGVSTNELTSAAITTSHVGLMATTWGSSTAMIVSAEWIRAYNGSLASNGFATI